MTPLLSFHSLSVHLFHGVPGSSLRKPLRHVVWDECRVRAPLLPPLPPVISLSHLIQLKHTLQLVRVVPLCGIACMLLTSSRPAGSAMLRTLSRQHTHRHLLHVLRKLCRLGPEHPSPILRNNELRCRWPSQGACGST